MKAKKAIKRLDKVEAILSDVINQYAKNGKETREILDAARSSIVRAKAGVTKDLKPANGKASPKAVAKQSGTKRKSVHPETAKAAATAKTA
ncbi:MAG: hypothetical protein ACR2I2_18800 [Bryobacteraceae bacterium]